MYLRLTPARCIAALALAAGCSTAAAPASPRSHGDASEGTTSPETASSSGAGAAAAPQATAPAWPSSIPGICNASAAVLVSGDRLLLADDESTKLFLYSVKDAKAHGASFLVAGPVTHLKRPQSGSGDPEPVPGYATDFALYRLDALGQTPQLLSSISGLNPEAMVATNEGLFLISDDDEERREGRACEEHARSPDSKNVYARARRIPLDRLKAPLPGGEGR